MLKDMFVGLLGYLKVFQIATRYRLWKYLFISGIMSVIVGFLLLYGGYAFGNNLGDTLFSWYKWDIGSGIVDKLNDWIGGILIVVVGVLLFKYIVLIIASPFMSHMSEELERKMTGQSMVSKFSMRRAMIDLKRGIIINLRNLIRELIIVGLLLILGFIPILTLFIPVLIFIVQSFYAGFGNLDFVLERHFNVRGSVKFVKANRFLAIGNGAVFLLLLMIPFLGWFIAPFFGAISATNAVVPKLQNAYTN